MSSATLLDKREFQNLTIKSPKDRQRLSAMLLRTEAILKQEFIQELASKLNTTSFQEVLRKVYFLDPSLPGRNFAETFLEGFKAEPLSGLPQETYLQIAVENLNLQIEKVRIIANSLATHNERIATGQEHMISPIKDLVDTTGFSKIALMKLFQLEVFSFPLTESDKELRGEIYQAGKVRHLGDTLMVIDQSIQPRGRAFRTMLSYSTEIDFGREYYSKYREELSDCFCPFPISESQVPDFCRNLAGFSIADQFVGISGLYEIAKSLGWKAASRIQSFANDELLEKLQAHGDDEVESRFFEALLPPDSTDYDIYNAAIANRDLRRTSNFRNRADMLLLPAISKSMLPSPEAQMPKHMKQARRTELEDTNIASSRISCTTSANEKLSLSSLLRFLDFRKNWPTDYNISSKSLGIVIETGMPLHRFLDDQEVEKLALSAEQREDYLAVLMLRYLPVIREYSEDADYLFLRALEDAVAADHAVNLVGFIDSISVKNPNFATGLILALSPRRLQKCYRCISDYQDMTSTHRSLLEIAARITGDLDLVIQADQIALDEKLASARAHFDSSRIFVDEVLFKNWALEEVSPSLQAVRKHIFLYSPELPENPTVDEIAASMKSGALQKLVDVLKEHFVDLPIKDAFRSFCLDHYFGVDSFLGRRIRHNATHGLLLGQLEKICVGAIEKDPQFEFEIQHAFTSWRREYLQEVDLLVSDKFRFKTSEFPNGLLSPSFETPSAKMAAVESELISQTIVNVKPEIIIQNMITGFWGVLEPELKQMRQFLKSEFTQSTLEGVDRHFDNLSSASMALAADLKVTLMERIERLASWYSPFSPADISISPADLAQMVWNDGEDATGMRDLIVEGNAGTELMTGSNVRTLYDCLHVVLVNAVKHSSGHSPVKLQFGTAMTKPEGVQELTIGVKSSLSTEGGSEAENTRKFQKMLKILNSEEISEKVMVVQGYSGLRKLRYLLFRTRRLETLSINWSDEEVSIGFDIPLNFVGETPDDSSD